MTADQVQVELRDNHLVVKGEGKAEREKEHEGTIVRERSFGSFLRSLALPGGVTADDVKASFANGELTVEVSLPTAAEATQIEVETLTGAAV